MKSYVNYQVFSFIVRNTFGHGQHVLVSGAKTVLELLHNIFEPELYLPVPQFYASVNYHLCFNWHSLIEKANTLESDFQDFKESHSSWKKTHWVVIDKEFSEMAALRSAMSHHVCEFHVIKWLTNRILKPKSQVNDAIEAVHMLLHASPEYVLYNEKMKYFMYVLRNDDQHPFAVYFRRKRHAYRAQWTSRCCDNAVHPRNNTSNR